MSLPPGVGGLSDKGRGAGHNSQPQLLDERRRQEWWGLGVGGSDHVEVDLFPNHFNQIPFCG